MKKELKDYLPLYIGQKASTLSGHNSRLNSVDLRDSCAVIGDELCPVENVTLHLRPLSDMKEEEYREMAVDNIDGFEMFLEKVKINDVFYAPEEFRYLLSRGFDLFGLIDSGLAIDKSNSEVKKV